MKKNEIEPVLAAMKKVPVAKFKDANLKQGVVNTYMQLLSEKRKLQEKKEDLQTVFLDSNKEEQMEVARLYRKLIQEKDPKKREAIASEFEKHGACILAAENVAKEVKKIGEEEADITPIDGASFIEAYTEMEECDLSVIEALYPLFTKKEETPCQTED